MKPTAHKPRRFTGLVSIALAAAAGLVARNAAADVELANVNGWEVFTDGRVGGFVSYVNGDAFPPSKSIATMQSPNAIQTPVGGGLDFASAAAINDLNAASDSQGKVESMRVRSGFLSNIVGFGVRNQVTPSLKLTAYTQFWSDIETTARRKYLPMPVDVRQGFLKLEGGWGSLALGRMLTLFSRGAGEIAFLYGHRYGVGYVPAVDDMGTSAGHVGFGVLGPGFASGLVYATPNLGGVQLNVGIFDPVELAGAWERTKFARPEAELTYDVELGSSGKVHLFVNGGWQKVYKNGYPDSISQTAYGTGYGGRFEFGPLHLGLAGHYGQGLGLSYALEASDAAFTPIIPGTLEGNKLRKSDGYYAQAQLAMSQFDVNVGVGVSRIHAISFTYTDPMTMLPVTYSDGAPDVQSGSTRSIIKTQLGISAGFVYHISQALHFDIDYFRADFRWYLGEKQVVNFLNTGLTAVW